MNLNKLSLSQKFASLLSLFVSVTCGVLLIYILAKNEPIDFAKQEQKGNFFQRPIENTLSLLMQHRRLAQRALYGDLKSRDLLPPLEKSLNESIEILKIQEKNEGEFLLFTDEGLKNRKREHIKIETIAKEWEDLQNKLLSLRPTESNDLHSHLIADLRLMITHLGDTSNLILDPDLDSYYLMDITLLGLPQAQDRIQNVLVELEPIIRRGATLTFDDRMKAKVFSTMMSEADLDRIKGDYQSVLNEDVNFSGKSETLEKNLSPLHESFIANYKLFIDMTEQISQGKLENIDRFLEISDAAADSSFKYWAGATIELDNLLKMRIDSIQMQKTRIAILSVIGLLICLGIAFLFIRNLGLNLKKILENLRQSFIQVSEAANKSSITSGDLSAASIQQASSIQQIMSAIEEISAMVHNTADSAEKAKLSAELNQSKSNEGSKRVDDMLNSILEIKESTEAIITHIQKSNEEFRDIAKIISEIGNKTNVINEIVFQTKLLSFNASVEAARAGESGKGFAVVAEEVGNLAQMSGTAAKEISDLLANSITKVHTLVEQTEAQVTNLVTMGKVTVETGQNTGILCKESLSHIIENARLITTRITEISVANKEQAKGVQEISNSISLLDEVTNKNAGMAAESSEQSNLLKIESESLGQSIHDMINFSEGTKVS